MTEEQLQALVELIEQVSKCSAGILQGSPNRTQIMERAIADARAALVPDESLTAEDYETIYGWGGQGA